MARISGRPPDAANLPAGSESPKETPPAVQQTVKTGISSIDGQSVQKREAEEELSRLLGVQQQQQQQQSAAPPPPPADAKLDKEFQSRMEGALLRDAKQSDKEAAKRDSAGSRQPSGLRFDPAEITKNLKEIAGELQIKPLAWEGQRALERKVETPIREGRLGRLEYKAGASADAAARIQANAKLDTSGLRGDAKGEVTLGASTQGRLEHALGELKYDLGAHGETRGQAGGQLTLDRSGLQGHLTGQAGAAASAQGNLDFRSRGVDIGGERLDVNGKAHVEVRAEAKAEGKANLSAAVIPPRASVDIGGKAFAGAKAEAEGKIGLGQFVTLSGHGGIWAGAGAEARLQLGFDEGKLRVGFGAGTARGVGYGGGLGIEVDTKRMAQAGLKMAANGIEKVIPGADGQKIVQGTTMVIDGLVGQMKTWGQIRA